MNETDLDLGSVRKYSTTSTLQKTTVTLKQSKLLAFVLAFNPIILLLILTIGVLCLSRSPISKDFGFAALLAGIDQDSLQMTKGAAYSGKLNRDRRLVFTVSDDDSRSIAEISSSPQAQRYGTVRMNLARFNRRNVTFTRNDKIKRGVVYG